MIKKLMAAVALVVVLGSCASREKLQYYQGIAEAVQQDALTYNPILKHDDLLMIIVSAQNPEAVKDFNLASYGVIADGSNTLGRPDLAGTQLRYQSYLIDNKGNIEFPVLGTIKLGGMERSAAVELLKSKIQQYVNNPAVTLRILNYKVTVQGEVTRPGTFSTTTERITLPEALGMAGDLTIYGKRDNILIIREIGGKKSYNFVDLTKADFINSPFYYLQQNDLVYVEPNKTKMNSSVVGANISVILTSVSLLITIVALLIR
ncbi:polysaccharide biosynthesis/export family protein [Flavobacterium antarcticum]|uniref:polysaccharide biosynthesis/export family protein n=1 Tax=Flavobacterium antarcticum TaxID=271155 RepID=UPI0003B71550|nr:polysaccharide biosynthesis/export family protein [Flavobacterium antarcticum]